MHFSELSKILSGHQPCQMVEVHQRFRKNPLCSHHQVCDVTLIPQMSHACTGPEPVALKATSHLNVVIKSQPYVACGFTRLNVSTVIYTGKRSEKWGEFTDTETGCIATNSLSRPVRSRHPQLLMVWWINQDRIHRHRHRHWHWLHFAQLSQPTREVKASSPVLAHDQFILHQWDICWWVVLLPPPWQDSIMMSFKIS